jgi:putative Mn2+ efflux pump MntP
MPREAGGNEIFLTTLSARLMIGNPIDEICEWRCRDPVTSLRTAMGSSDQKCNMELVRHVLTWINWILMLALGCYNCYLQFDDSKGSETVSANKVQKILSIYIAVFGLIGIIFEARVKAVYNNIAFLQSKSGRGVFFIFIGTLCFAFAGSADLKAIGKAAAWVLGGFSCFVGIFNFCTICCFKEKDEDDEASLSMTRGNAVSTAASAI